MECAKGISAEEKKLIIQLRQRILHELPLTILSKSEEDQALYLVRWLRARDYDLDNATNMLRSSLQWRKERNADFAAGKLLHPFFHENFPYRFSGLDNNGNPIVLIYLSQWKFSKLLNDTQRLQEFDDFVIKFFETIMTKLRTEDLLRKGRGQSAITQATFINDVKDYPYTQLIRLDAVKKILQLMSVYEAHYPEIMFQGIFINCPTYFGIFINMLKPVLSPRTHGKIRYYAQSQSAKWKSEMVELLDPAAIPEQYGGTLKK